MIRRWLPTLILAALTSAACSIFDRNSTPAEPTVTGVQQLQGNWASVSSTTTLANTCTNFAWRVTEIEGTSGSGTFTATCLDAMPVTGTASGSLSGDKVTWSATATGTTGTGAACAILLSGSATIESGQIRVPYSGTACGTAITGIEILRKS